MKILIGTSGWSYPGWRGLFYPPELKPADWLEYYASQFSTVEINMTFYRSPRPEILRGWVARVPEDFQFTLKASREITHRKKLKNVEHDLEHLAFLARQLKNKAGCLLYQLPPSLTLDLELLREFLSSLPPGFRHVVEFRHPSWYKKETYDLLAKHGVSFCVVSSARVPPEVVLTSGTAYFRFHGLTGGYRYRYTDEELLTWSKKINGLKAEECYVYFNNDYRAHAVFNALTLKKLLGL
jgi:uncharacterized protein YecE (DUF72 family)